MQSSRGRSALTIRSLAEENRKPGEEPDMNQLSRADMRRVAALWRDLADAPAAECDAALRHCMARLQTLVGACNATWVGVNRQRPAADDPLGGWRIREVDYLHHRDRRMVFARELSERLRAGQHDPCVGAIVRGAGHTRSHLREELVPAAIWRESWIVREALAEERIGDRLAGAHSVSRHSESHLVLDRAHGDRPFGARERDLLQFFLLGSRSFHRELLLSRGLIDASAPFSPRERDVLRLLLTDAGEKEIARVLNIGHRTVHQHAASIYAKLGVRGRQGLMAQWLR